MTVGELLTRKPGGAITVPPTVTVARAARLLLDRGIGGLPVVEDGSLVGFVSERELVWAIDRHPRNVHDLLVRSVMRSPAPVCGSEDRIPQVMARMTRERLRHLVVVDHVQVVGVISVGDLVKTRVEELKTETGVLRDYVAAHRAMR
jgi:CBS domain-containing protein